MKLRNTDFWCPTCGLDLCIYVVKNVYFIRCDGGDYTDVKTFSDETTLEKHLQKEYKRKK